MIEVTLPGGFERDGAWRQTVWLRAWSGRDEAFFAEDAAASPAARTTALLARCLALAPPVHQGEGLGEDPLFVGGLDQDLVTHVDGGDAAVSRGADQSDVAGELYPPGAILRPESR